MTGSGVGDTKDASPLFTQELDRVLRLDALLTHNAASLCVEDVLFVLTTAAVRCPHLSGWIGATLRRWLEACGDRFFLPATTSVAVDEDAMDMENTTLSSQDTAEWTTIALKCCRVLLAQGFWYEEDHLSTLPMSLFVKICQQSEASLGAGVMEARRWQALAFVSEAFHLADGWRMARETEWFVAGNVLVDVLAVDVSLDGLLRGEMDVEALHRVRQVEMRNAELEMLTSYRSLEERVMDLLLHVPEAAIKREDSVVTVEGFSLPRKQLSFEDKVDGDIAMGGSRRSNMGQLIHTATTRRNLSRLAEALLLPRPILVSGESGSGKTAILRELALLTGHSTSLVILHPSDQTDAKALIGGYICSDVPGEFVWQSGALTTAVLSGAWVVVEDIDRVPLDLLALLAPLLESRQLALPHRVAPVLAHPEFRLFATRSISSSASSAADAAASAAAAGVVRTVDETDEEFSVRKAAAGLVAREISAFVPALRHFSHQWQYVDIESLSLEEGAAVLSAKHPNVPSSLIDRVMKVFRDLSDRAAIQKQASKRATDAILAGDDVMDEVSDEEDAMVIIKNENAVAPQDILSFSPRPWNLRDLLKVLARIERHCPAHSSGYLTEASRLATLKDLIDVVAASVRGEFEYVTFARFIGELWGVTPSEVDVTLLQAVPEISVERITATDVQIEAGLVATRVKIGRAIFEGTQDESAVTTRQTFAQTAYARRLLERVAAGVEANEPLLLVGETGCGKTTVVQELSALVGVPLTVQNLSLASDVSDLLGGYRPVTLRQMLLPLYEKFSRQFQETLNTARNSDFLQALAGLFSEQRWRKVLKAMEKGSASALTRLRSQRESRIAKVSQNSAAVAAAASSDVSEDNQSLMSLSSVMVTSHPTVVAVDAKIHSWESLSEEIRRFTVSLPKLESGFAFAFQRGLLVEAMEKGEWILLDELNLASPETLQGLSAFLDPTAECVVADSNQAELRAIRRHPSFRIFAAMNPPTDLCKKELPASMRSRFTECYVPELTDRTDLMAVVSAYLSSVQDAPIGDIVDVYLGCRAAAEENLSDGTGQRPRYSLRSLTRSLRATRSFLRMGMRPLGRCLYEAFLLNFQTMLSEQSRPFMREFLRRSLYPPENGASLTGKKKDLDFPCPRPGGRGRSGEDYALVAPFWLETGPLSPVNWNEKDSRGVTRFVSTPTVHSNIRTLAAAIAAEVAPVLLQGPTSVGKTTMIQYIAALSGHRCLRINNHEHTDVAEYVGSYVTSSDGALVFQDGLLVEALRRGDWLILDELNLAPSDVLEALNRLLDDNRELLIAETGEIVKPAPGFMLFATQNPPGVYGGRKPLSLAFRNRFIEVDLSDLPPKEVESIVSESCGFAPKFATMLVSVMTSLQTQRQTSTALQGKHGAVTTRDLIKWGRRQPHTPEEVAAEGFMLLAEKLRDHEEQEAVAAILRKECKVPHFDPLRLYDEQTVLRAAHKAFVEGSLTVEGVSGVALTNSFSRMWTLLCRALDRQEPVLLIGETGCGKTMVCQLYAAYRQQCLRVLNCHQSTETADMIGGLRPVRGREGLRAELLEIVQSALISLPLVAVQLSEEGVALPLTADTESSVVRVVLDALVQVCSPSASVLTATDSTPTTVVSEEVTANAEFNETRHSHTRESLSEIHTKLLRALSHWQRLRTLFEWEDGPLVTAMKEGDVLLLDEINLAEDAVIERLNSVLESSRELTLAEKGGGAAERLIGAPDFRIVATMNPSGDFGKRELSPALRSRFTEIWVPAVRSEEELSAIICEVLRLPQSAENDFANYVTEATALLTSSSESSMEIAVSTPRSLVQTTAEVMLRFMSWVNHRVASVATGALVMSIREILAWASFLGAYSPQTAASVYEAILHGAFLTILDGLGIGQSLPREAARAVKSDSLEFLLSLAPQGFRTAIREATAFLLWADAVSDVTRVAAPRRESGEFRLGTFSVPLGPLVSGSSQQEDNTDSSYALDASSTVLNLGRVMRAMQIHRPILLEGPPGVGKSSLIAAFARATGHRLVRINLSEHSELADLLGSDLPVASSERQGEDSVVSGGDAVARFKWCDGVFLTAMREGAWVLLDELNLAPQAVLEGLNACFDHRETVFLPEIGQSVRCAPSFRVFCAQNPMGEGGGRKGLPASFLSRFTRVYVEAMNRQDMEDIVQRVARLPTFPPLSAGLCGNSPPVDEISMEITEESSVTAATEVVRRMLSFIESLELATVAGELGREGAPWEFNLRDTFRWCELLATLAPLDSTQSDTCVSGWRSALCESAYALFSLRMRTIADRQVVATLFSEAFGFPLAVDAIPPITYHRTTPNELSISESDSEIEGAITLQVGNSSTGGLKASPVHLPVYSSASLLASAAHGLTTSGNASANGSSWAAKFGTGGVGAGGEKIEQALAYCVALRWPALLVGPAGSGKRRFIESLATACGATLQTLSALPSLDGAELLGSFEQRSLSATLTSCLSEIEQTLMLLVPHVIVEDTITEKSGVSQDVILLALSQLRRCQQYAKLSEAGALSVALAVNDGEATRDLAALFGVVSGIVHGGHITADTPLAAKLHNHFSAAEAAHSTLLHMAEMSSVDGSSGSAGGAFAWEDGAVVSAAIAGHWLVIDNVNLASAAVLDRLNSLLEPGGGLVLTEDGSGRLVMPSPNFRIFFTSEAGCGEVSRAMRNRCMELYLVTAETRSLAHFFDWTVAAKTAPSTRSLLAAETSALLSALNIPVAAIRTERSLETMNRQRTIRRVISRLDLLLSLGMSLKEATSRIYGHNSPLHILLQRNPVGLGSTPNAPMRELVTSARIRAALLAGHITAREAALLRLQESALSGDGVDFLPSEALSLASLLSSAHARAMASPGTDIESLLMADSAVASFVESLTKQMHIMGKSTSSNSGENDVEATFHISADVVLALLAWHHVRGELDSAMMSTQMSAPAVSSVDFLSACFKAAWPKSEAVEIAYLNTSEQTSSSTPLEDALERGLLLRRAGVLLAERQIGSATAHHVADAWGAAEASFPLYALGHAVYSRLLAADSRELAVLGSAVSLLVSGEALLLRLTPILRCVASQDSNTDFATASELIITAITGGATGAAGGVKVADTAGASLSEETRLLKYIAEAWARRDLLAAVLCGQSASAVTLRGVSWDATLVAARWLLKSLSRLVSLLSSTTSPALLAAFAASVSEGVAWSTLRINVIDASARLTRTLASLWTISNSQDASGGVAAVILNRKSRLWKAGGHAAVPTDVTGWQLLHRLRLVVSASGESAKSFEDSSYSSGLASDVSQGDWREVLTLPRSPQLTAALSEWLAVYGAVYWARSTETRVLSDALQDSASTPQATIQAMREVVSSVSSKVWTLLHRTTHKAPSLSSLRDSVALLDPAERESSLLSSSLTYHRISADMAARQSLSVALLAEEALLHNLAIIGEILSTTTLLSVSETSSEEARQLLYRLTNTCEMSLSLALRFVPITPAALRELRTLAWLAEAALSGASKSGHNSTGSSGEDALRRNWVALMSVGRRLLVSLDRRRHNLTIIGRLGMASSLYWAYGSPTLRYAVNAELDDTAAFSAALTTGGLSAEGFNAASAAITTTAGTGGGGSFVSGVSPVALSLALRQVDARILFPDVEALGTLQSRGSPGYAEVSLATASEARRALLLTFQTQLYLQKSTQVVGAKSSNLENIGGVRQLTLYLADLLAATRDGWDVSIWEMISVPLKEGLRAGEITVIPFLNRLLAAIPVEVGGDSPVSNASVYSSGEAAESLISLVRLTIVPALRQLIDALKSDSIHALAIAVGPIWVRVGCARFQLSLPAAPVDPAALPAHKAALLRRALATSESLTATQMLAAVGSGEAMVNSSLSGEIHAMLSLRDTINRYEGRSVKRPEIGSSECGKATFSELFDELHVAASGPLSPELLLSLISALESALANTSSGSSLVSVRRQVSTLQTSINALSQRTATNFVAYEDVWSTPLSAAENISRGLSLSLAALDNLSSYSKNISDEKMAIVDSKSNDTDSVISSEVTAVWELLCDFLVPVTATDIQDPAAQLTHLLGSAEALLSRLLTTIRIATTCTSSAASAVGYTNISNGTLGARQLESMAALFRAALQLCLLARIDYALATTHDFAHQRRLATLLSGVLSDYADRYVAAAEAKAAAAAKAEEMYRYADDRAEAAAEAAAKNGSSTLGPQGVPDFAADREAERVFRAAFPDHLRELAAFAATNSEDDMAMDGPLANGFQAATDTDVIPNAVAAEAAVVWSVISSHARGVLLSPVYAQALAGPAAAAALPRRRLYEQLNGRHVALLAKTCEATLSAVVVPELAAPSKRAALSLTALMASAVDWSQRSQTGSGTLANETADALWTRLAAAGVDRDLLLLLDADAAGSTDLTKPISVNVTKTGKSSKSQDNALSGPPHRPHSFHFDACPAEASRVAAPLAALFARAAELLEQFPGNELLLRVCRLTTQVASLHATIPLGKALAAIQLLLRCAQEWENHAARHVSLSAQMAPLTALIGRWRLAELRSWEGLLRASEINAVRKAAPLWFSLLRVFRSEGAQLSMKGNVQFGVTAPLSAAALQNKWAREAARQGVTSATIAAANRLTVTSEMASQWPILGGSAPAWLYASMTHMVASTEAHLEATECGAESIEFDKHNTTTLDSSKTSSVEIDEFLARVLTSLDTFLRTSPVGEFPTRLHLLRLLALTLLQDSAGHSLATLLLPFHHRLLQITLSVWQYYSQFLPTVRRFQATLRRPLETAVRDEAKLGKWDGVTVYATVEAAEKSHRKLAKLAKTYESETLSFPVGSVLTRELLGGFVDQAMEATGGNSSVIPSFNTIWPQLSGLSVAAAEAGRAKRAKSAEPGDSTEDVVDLAVKLTTTYRYATASTAKGVPSAVRRLVNELDNSDESNQRTSKLAQALRSDHTRLLRIPSLAEKAASLFTSWLDFASAIDEEEESEDDEESMEVDSQAKHSSILESTLTTAIERAKEIGPQATFGLRLADMSESMSSRVFARLSALREPDVTKPMKLRAIRDLISTLRSHGFANLRSDLPLAALRSTSRILCVTSALPALAAIDLVNGTSTAAASTAMAFAVEGDGSWQQALTMSDADAFSRGERYLLRCQAELPQLRTASVSSVHRDLSAREATTMVTLCESLYLTSLRMRSAVEAAIVSYNGTAREVATLTRHTAMWAVSSTLLSPNSAEIIANKSRDLADLILRQLLAAEPLIATAKAAASLVTSSNSGEVSPLESETSSDISLQVSDSVDYSSLNVFTSAQLSSLSDAVSTAIRELSGALAAEADPQSAHLWTANLADYSADSHTSATVTPPIVGFAAANRVFSTHSSIAAPHLRVVSIAAFAKRAEKALRAVQTELGIVLGHDSVNSLWSGLTSISETIAELSNNSSVNDEIKADNLSTDVLSAISSVSDECLVAVQRLRTLVESVHSAECGNAVSLSGVFDEPILRLPVEEGSDDHSSSTAGAVTGGGIPVQFGLSHLASLSMSVVGSLRLDRVTEALEKLNQLISTGSNSLSDGERQLVAHLLGELSGLLRTLQLGSAALMSCLGAGYGAYTKFQYVILRVVRVLLAQGICSTSSGEGEGDGDGNGDASGRDFEADGTGMGDGEGTKDVSDEIENEEQLLGTKQENPEDSNDPANSKEERKLDKEEAEGGVEMTADFDGEMCDLPSDAEQPQEEDEEEEDGEEADREMGTADDADVVDERQWDDEEDEKNQEDGPEKFEDSKAAGTTLDELRTKDDDEEDDDKPSAGAEEDQKPSPQEEPAMDDDTSSPEINEDRPEDKMEKPAGIDVRSEPPTAGDEEEDGGDDNEGEEPTAGGDEGDDGGKEEEAPMELPDSMDLGGEDEEDADGADNDGEEEADTMDTDETLPPQPDEEEPPVEEDTGGDRDILGGSGNLPDEDVPPPPEQEEEKEDPIDRPVAPKDRAEAEEAPPKPAAHGIAAADGKDSILDRPEEENAADASDAPPPPTGGDGDTGDGAQEKSAGATGESNTSPQNPSDDASPQSEETNRAQPLSSEPNPFMRGDVTEAWFRRLNLEWNPDQHAVSEQDDKEEAADGTGGEEPPSGEEPPTGLFEFCDEKTADGTQVLGATSAEDAVALPEEPPSEESSAPIVPPNEEEEETPPPAPTVDERKRDREEANTGDETPSKKPRNDKSAPPATERPSDSENPPTQKPNEDDSMAVDEESEEEGPEITPTIMEEDDIEQPVLPPPPPITTNRDFRFSSDQHSTAEPTVIAPSTVDEDDESVIQTLVTQESRETWQSHRIATEGHAIRLAEQLRLILEPTLATRLQGDYRTGKRINMRKVIPYIASGFRKDKIWLRRTKPAKRDYQVMLMIDDSRSMSAASSLALSSLALLSTALSRLEIGELAVASFSDRIRMLHPFGTPFSEESGAQLAAQFQFSADYTRLGDSLAAVAPVMAAARERLSSAASSAAVLQLCFIITDARIDSDNRARLEATVRSLAEQHVMAVLVIVDCNENARDSIFNTKSVAFVGNKVVTRSYFDDFPFPFYVAIQRMEAMPEVLAEALKQWFELVRLQLAA